MKLEIAGVNIRKPGYWLGHKNPSNWLTLQTPQSYRLAYFTKATILQPGSGHEMESYKSQNPK